MIFKFLWALIKGFFYLVILVVVGFVYLSIDDEIGSNDKISVSDKQAEIDRLNRKINKEKADEREKRVRNRAIASNLREIVINSNPVNLGPMITKDISQFSKSELDLLQVKLVGEIVSVDAVPISEHFPKYNIGAVISTQINELGVSELKISFKFPFSYWDFIHLSRIICTYKIFDESSYQKFANLFHESEAARWQNKVAFKGSFKKLTVSKLGNDVRLYLNDCQF